MRFGVFGFDPEPPVEPPESDYFTASGCGHEIYEGEYAYEYEGKVYCPDCLREKIFDLDTDELADLLGIERVEMNG